MLKSLHLEKSFEEEICEYLAGHGFLYSPDDTGYDRELALFPEDLTEWVKTIQPKAWETLEKMHCAKAAGILAKRVRGLLNEVGTLPAIRERKVDLVGVRQSIPLARFKPAMGLNEAIVKEYQANRLRIMRQVHYSLHNENSIDLVLFLNGIPVFTFELKTDFTQSIRDAVDQYKYDRKPENEPLLSFPSGTLVHFAVSNSEVEMTTKLEGGATRFLPFNKGRLFPDGRIGKGNSDNPDGHPVSYLWEDVLERDSLLDLLNRYMVTERNKKKELVKYIFPRYHQLRSTRKLVDAVLTEGTGRRYLIQHSAGSGKTNSIAWTAHFFADLHDAGDRKVFNSVIIVSDRTVIDDQLQEAALGMQRNEGVVEILSKSKGSKSTQLAEALKNNKKIIVCTIQSFPALLKSAQELTKTDGKRFAVIADEAHSSQSGTAVSDLKQILSDAEMKELADGGEYSIEDWLAAQMNNRAAADGITYVAFTATPKSKTMELFGRLPHPELPKGPGNQPEPFDIYSMRQAIEEGFILDVLDNYYSCKTSFKLGLRGRELPDTEVERGKASGQLRKWVKLTAYNIAEKVAAIVEHYRETVMPLLGGRAKAMIVVSSRLEAVRWKLALDKYIQQNNYPLGTLVAFSGEVKDKETFPEGVTENSEKLNPKLNKQDIRKAFEPDEFKILLVANKFQTGFDQPLLCGMYIDKRLDGIQAVQTLSRLNRCAPGKDKVYIVDFANDAETILDAFKTYYEKAELSGVSDPEQVIKLKNKLDSMGHYDAKDVDAVIKVCMKKTAKQSELEALISPIASRIKNEYRIAKTSLKNAVKEKNPAAEKEARDVIQLIEMFIRDLRSYQKMYSFLSQLYDFGNPDFEKRHMFYRVLLPQLDLDRERDEIDLTGVELTHYRLGKQVAQTMLIDETKQINPITASGSGHVNEPEKAKLSKIIEKLNEIFGSDVTVEDKLSWLRTKREKLAESPILIEQAMSNTREQMSASKDLMTVFIDAIINSDDAQGKLSREALSSELKLETALNLMLDIGGLYERLREKGNQNHQLDGVGTQSNPSATI